MASPLLPSSHLRAHHNEDTVEYVARRTPTAGSRSQVATKCTFRPSAAYLSPWSVAARGFLAERWEKAKFADNKFEAQ